MDSFALAAAVLLAIAALLKSAQFPTHGWLTEVMEAPTPVSALLHAGVINGGGFLLVRFADVMLGAPGVLGMLAIIGGTNPGKVLWPQETIDEAKIHGIEFDVSGDLVYRGDEAESV